MGIKRISNNKYKITIECGYDILGTRKRKVVTFNGSKIEADRKEAELKSQYYRTCSKANLNDLTFKQLSQIFIEKYCKPNVSLITISGYETSLSRILPIIGDIKINKITPYTLDCMYQELKIGLDGHELGYCSQYNYYKLVNVIFNQAIKWDFIDNNPNKKACKPKKEHKEKHFYDINQVKKLLDVLDNESIKYKTLILLALDSGARRSELCALRWSDIDVNTKTMSITKSLKVVNGIEDEKTTKTNSSIRKIVLSDATIKQLLEYKKWHTLFKEQNKTKWTSNDDRIFTSVTGQHMNPSTCDHILKKIVNKYNLEPISFHELRHTCASLLINSGVDPKTVSRRLGHSDTSVTMEIYTHTFESSKIACADKFDEMMKNIENA